MLKKTFKYFTFTNNNDRHTIIAIVALVEFITSRNSKASPI